MLLPGCLCCILTHTSCRAPERTAWLHLVLIHPVHSVRAGRGVLQGLWPLHYIQNKKEVTKPFNVSWQDLEQGSEMELDLSQSLLLLRSSKVAYFGKLRESFPHPVSNLSLFLWGISLLVFKVK